MKSPLFLDWNTPWLPRLAEKLLTSWALERKKPCGDLAETIVILPGRRAGRRLLALLALQAASQQIVLLPPRIVTLREAIPFLLPLKEKSWSEAGALACHLAWSEAVKKLTEEEWAALQPDTSFEKKETHFVSLIEQLAEHLGMQGLSFSKLLACIGALYPESADREEARWRTLVAVQKKYQSTLHAWGLMDPHDALERHLLEGEFDHSYRVLVAGVIDAPDCFAPFFEKVAPSLFIIAPQDHAAGFDAHGTLLPAYWLAHPPCLKKNQLLPCHYNEDQAEELLKLLHSCKSPPSGFVTIVAQAEALPTLRDRLALSAEKKEESFQLHWGGGLPFYHGRLYQLLKATAEFIDCKDSQGPSYEAIGALLRHPDIGRHCWEVEHLLKKLDDYAQEHPSSVLQDKSFRPFLELEKIIALPSSPGTLASCVTELRDFLWRIFGDESVSGSTSEGHYLLGCLKKILEQLEALEELSEKMSRLWSIAEVITLLLKVMAFEAIPEREEPEALECVGWLELMADDAPCAIVTSCHEGFLPRSAQKHPLLPERLCKAFKLGDSATLLARDLYLLHLINSSRELKIIAPCTNARGEFVRPSRLLTLGCSQQELSERVLTLLHPPGKKEKNLTTTSSTLQARLIGKEPIERVTVTGLRTYLASPRLFYLKHVLKLKEIPPAPLEMTPSHFGTLLHGVLGAFGKDFSMADAVEVKLLAAWLRKKLFSMAALHLGPVLSPLILLQLEEASKTLVGFAKLQAAHRRAGWKIIATENVLEEKITLADGRSLFLQGRVDRIDWHPIKQRWLLIDYKTSNQQQWKRANPDAEHYQKKGETIVWHDLQLPLYLKLAPYSESLQKSGLPVPTPDNTDLVFCQLPLEYEQARFSSFFSQTMILPAWKEAEQLLTRILDHDFEEIGTIDAARMPTFAALCGIV
ncbi:MAG: PD-(D/E)XK nuclease family protein [Chthoniobacterales bacterium]|nr:PD-(D/E)XK nuclease family protein [Chthoniobacterales bacterium]